MYLKRSLALLLSATMAVSMAGCSMEDTFPSSPENGSSSSSSEAAGGGSGGAIGGPGNSSSSEEENDDTLLPPASSVEEDESTPVAPGSSITPATADELEQALESNPNVTTVDFRQMNGSIPTGVLQKTRISKVIVSPETDVNTAFYGLSGLTIEVTGSGQVNSSILGGASGVTLDLRGCTDLEEIELEAFRACGGLDAVDLSGCTSLKCIEDHAFSSCWNLSRVNLSGCTSLATIGTDAFVGSNNLVSIDLSGCTSLTEIQQNAFVGCRNLVSVHLRGASLKEIGSDAFSSCESLTDISFPANLERIYGNAFYGCTSLTSIDLSGCVQMSRIGRNAFRQCTSLKSVVLPTSGMLHIESGAFMVGDMETEEGMEVPLDLWIPGENMVLEIDSSVWEGAFKNRIVTVYYNGRNADEIRSALADAGAKGTGDNGTIEVFRNELLPWQMGQADGSLLGLFFNPAALMNQ